MSTIVTEMSITIEYGRVVLRFAEIDLRLDPDVALDLSQKLAVSAAAAIGSGALDAARREHRGA